VERHTVNNWAGRGWILLQAGYVAGQWLREYGKAEENKDHIHGVIVQAVSQHVRESQWTFVKM
jgi:hypothetical protein